MLCHDLVVCLSSSNLIVSNVYLIDTCVTVLFMFFACKLLRNVYPQCECIQNVYANILQSKLYKAEEIQSIIQPQAYT